MDTALMRPWLASPLAGLAIPSLSGTLAPECGTPFPALNAWADDQALHLEAELPGVPTASLAVTVEGDELTLAGERPDLVEAGVTEHRRERATGRFSRIVRLPFGVDAARVEASLKDGVLVVTLPRAEAERPRRIQLRKVGA
jgi:HSP20 family protein